MKNLFNFMHIMHNQISNYTKSNFKLINPIFSHGSIIMLTLLYCNSIFGIHLPSDFHCPFDMMSKSCEEMPSEALRLCAIYGNGTPTVTTNNGENISTYFPPNGNGDIIPPTGILIQVNGTLFVDGNNFRGNQLRFKMADGAQIVLLCNKLYSAGCKFFSCNKMWKGITTDYCQSAMFVNSLIEDAEYALSVYEHTSISLVNTKFTLNFVGIKNLGPSLKLSAPVGNEFKGDVVLNLRPYFSSDILLQESYDNTRSYAGLLLDNCMTTVGQKSSNGNSFKFSRTLYGIKATNGSNVNVNGCSFTNIYGPPGANDIWPCGISSEGFCTFKINSCKFQDVYEIGIYSSGSHLEVDNTSFIHCNIGIFSTENFNGQLMNVDKTTFRLNSNIFEDVRGSSATSSLIFGILLNRSSGMSSDPVNEMNSITYCKFFHEGDVYNSFSVQVEEQTESWGEERIKFNHNKSTFTSDGEMLCGYKLKCYKSNNVFVEYDTFYFDNPTLKNIRNGINAHSIGSGHKMLYNTFIAADAVKRTMNKGIETEHFTNVEYCGNVFRNGQYGVYFAGNCDNSSFATSDFDNCKVGFEINGKVPEIGRIGEQDKKGNEWKCNISAGDFAAICNQATRFSRMIIETDLCVRFPLSSKITPSNWFELFIGSPNDCFNNLSPCFGFDGISIYDSDILVGNYPEGPSNGAYIFYNDYQMMYRIFRKPTLLNCNNVSSYYNNRVNENYSKLAELLLNIRSKIAIPQSIQTQLKSNQEDRLDILYQIEVISDNYIIGDTTENDTIYFNQLTSLLNQLKTLQISDNSQYSELQIFRNTEMTALNVLNNQISPNNVWEQNLKTMNTFVIKMYLNTLYQADWDQVEAIANTSVEIGGPATLHAQVWFPGSGGQQLAGPTKYIKTAIGIKTNNLQEGNTNSEIKIFPNPVNNAELNIQAGKGIRYCEVSSLQGEIISTFNGKGNENIELPIKNLVNGSYLLKLIYSDGSIKVLKFIK